MVLATATDVLTTEDTQPLESFILKLHECVQNGNKSLLFIYEKQLSIKEFARRLLACCSYFSAPYDISVNYDIHNKDRLVYLVKKANRTEYTLVFNLKKADKKIHKIK